MNDEPEKFVYLKNHKGEIIRVPEHSQENFKKTQARIKELLDKGYTKEQVREILKEEDVI